MSAIGALTSALTAGRELVDIDAGMPFEPSLEEQELLADTFRRADSALTSRERVAEAAVGLGFAVAVTCLWLARPPHLFALLPAAVSMLVLALATRVRFDTPFGFTVPTQLGFVPLLFAMPTALVPIAVVVALAMGRLPDVLAGRTRPGRLLLTVGNSWFAIGPVGVFAVANIDPRHAGVALLLAALAAQFVLDHTVSTLRFSTGRGVSLRTQLRDTWVYAIDAALSGIALVVAEDMHTAPAAALALLPLLGVFAVFARERHERLESLLELNNAYRGTALVLGDVVEADDGYTGAHCKSVVGLALALGEKLELDAGQRRNLEFGALLHDVGKIAIPKEIINKPGKLEPDEWTIVKTHTLEGQKMLDRVGGFMRSVGLIVRSHHERWDGGGYPDGLAGEGIPLEARIISCCDSWNAMRTDRSYREALPYDAALAELVANAGGQFDPNIVEALVGLVEPAADRLVAASGSARRNRKYRPSAKPVAG
jgi:putative nucleotidyltransferase with HDIG domain